MPEEAVVKLLARQAYLRRHTATARAYTPYLRATREGYRGGQLLFTAGPLTVGETRALERETAHARLKRIDAQTLIHTFEMRLSLAQQLAAHPAFYLPHNIDFRGRAYPIPPYLHHLGDDVSKGLLQFAQGQPLGRHGLSWLMVQLANCYGHGKDKLPMAGRLQWGQSCLHSCMEAAADPLSPAGSWWRDGESPWRLLATALEIAAALKSGNPTSFLSRLPVHQAVLFHFLCLVLQDGSCNGLQHYAALARDYRGAAAVNLVPSDKPQDVYSAVANEVGRRIREDAAAGIGEARTLLARNKGTVDRKLVKQTVMTSVYGVTAMGARDQVANRLTERGWNKDGELEKVSRYVAQQTLASIGSLFANAQGVKDWLADCAKQVARSGVPVTWTSPIGFPCSQPYFREKERTRVATSLVSITLTPGLSTTVDLSKQRSAFAPNFVHSLDAAHMMMTAQECARQGITFAGVHDSYWTHAGNVDALGQILRDKFVELHRQPLLSNLAEELASRSGAQLAEVPPLGDFDLELVKSSVYFFA
ncbi:mitochondrial single-subunit RNA polymerase [Haematococcus lacustris]